MIRKHQSPTWILHFENKKLLVKTDSTSYFIYAKNLQKNFVHGDTVAFTITKKAADWRLPEAKITKLIKRSESVLLGYKIGKYIFPLPQISNIEKIKIGPFSDNFPDNSLVEFTIENTIAKILQKFESTSWDNEIESILFMNNIPEKWSPEVKKQEKFLQKIQFDYVNSDIPFRADMLLSLESSLLPEHKIDINLPYFVSKINFENEQRIDLRNWHTITIDGADAKDLDDAISIARFENGDFLLWIHIADVSFFVEEKSAIDIEANNRGTSIYLPTRVIPMLPETLSNNLCSLQPGSDKNTLTCLMRIHPKSGKVLHTDIFASIIKSDHRGIYEDIFSSFENKNFENSSMEKTLTDAFDLFEILKKRRAKEWKISFETTELYFGFDEEKIIPTSIKKRERNNAHMLIEEFMVIANEEVAKWCQKRKIPFLSRIHPEPSEESSQIIEKIIKTKPKKWKKITENTITPKDISSYLDKLDKNAHYNASRLILPKMSKAYYSIDRSGHFGLALENYSHFTSPIRRYPDLITHRMIHLYLKRKLDENSKKRYQKILAKIAEKSSSTEKRAEGIEREVDKIYALRFMKNRIGEQFDAIITSVIEWWIFLELSIGIEVVIFLDKNKKYQVDNETGSLIDKYQNIIHKIGDTHIIEISSIQEWKILAKIIK